MGLPVPAIHDVLGLHRQFGVGADGHQDRSGLDMRDMMRGILLGNAGAGQGPEKAAGRGADPGAGDRGDQPSRGE